MNIVSSKVQIDYLRKELAKATHEEMCIGIDRNQAVEDIARMEKEAGGDKDLLAEIKQSDDYQDLVEYDNECELRLDNLDVEIDIIKQEMENFSTLEKDGIGEATKFWCFGG